MSAGGAGARVLLVALMALFGSGCVESVGEQTADGGAVAQPTPPEAVRPEGHPELFGFGQAAGAELIRRLDIDVMPDGRGLPPGSGTPAEGERIYMETCIACHGPTGTEGPYDRLVGPSLADGARFGSARAIGNYWPYATTLFDYVRRAMPYDRPGILGDDQVYSLTAFLLHRNGIVPEDAVMNAETLPQVVMPARDLFVVDDRTGGPVVR